MAFPALRNVEAVEAPAQREAGAVLSVVADGRRRWPAIIGGGVLFVALLAMFGAAVFHTQLAQRQIRVDQLEQDVNDEGDRFDELRRDRAVLRSPERISAEAAELGMVPADEVRFVEIDPLAFARQLAAAGATDDSTGRVIVETGPLDQFRDVKSVSEGQP